MERVISDEEKIRRAIEISQRRNKNYNLKQTTRVNINDKKNYKLFKKMILQLIICLIIYSIFYLITSTNYILSKKVIETTTAVLNYDINFKKIYNNTKNFINSKINSAQNSNESSNTNNEINQDKSKENSEDSNKENEKKVSKEKKTQMELDAEQVKKLCKFQKPISGTITSEFGEREVTSKFMSSNHKGIDVAAKSGTNIKAAMAGTVSVAEENSEYGKFIKIVDGDVMTVYAHCKKIKVKVGDKVKIGKTIATVGTTGNSTGPHLHFEIRLSNRYINPRYVIQF